jgi:YVTN family beta-propeller protein
VVSVGVGLEPQTATYDAGNGYVYVTNYGSDSVTVLNGTQVVRTIDVGNTPWTATYDSGNGNIYLPNDGGRSLTVINGVQSLGEVEVGTYPQTPAYDSGDGYLYVPNAGTNNVSVINGTQVVATVAVGTSPGFATYDAGNGYVYVGNFESDTVSILNGTTVIGTVDVVDCPGSAAYDSLNGYVYVGGCDDFLTVISGTTVVGSADIGGYPGSLTCDTGNGYIYVTKDTSGEDYVNVVNGLTTIASIDVESDSYGAVYDGGNGYVYVSDTQTGAVSVFDGTKVVGSVAVGSEPLFAAYDAGNGDVYVPNQDSDSVSVLLVNYTMTLTEMGLPEGMGWWVNVSGGPSTFSSGPTASVGVGGGTHTFSAASVDKSYTSLGGRFTVGGPASEETVLFSRVTFPVSFLAVGMENATGWSVTLDGSTLASTSGTITFAEPNGTYRYTVGKVPGWTPSVDDGIVVVNGSAVSENVGWVAVTYLVTFQESGLVGTGWWVHVDGGVSTHSDSSTLAFEEPNGSYSYTVSSDNRSFGGPGGSFDVHGTHLLEQVAFAMLTYVVAFAEEGLPTGTLWSASLAGTANLSIGSTLTFTMSNGTYPFTVRPQPGYDVSPASGTIGVSGGDVRMGINFTSLAAAAYSVTFSESGLPNGTPWTVTMNGVVGSGLGRLTFQGVANGTYPYSVGPVGGYAATPRNGSVTIDGFGGLVGVVFAAIGPSTPSPGFVLSEEDGVFGGCALVVAAAALLLLIPSGGRKEPPRDPPRPPPDADPDDFWGPR